MASLPSALSLMLALVSPGSWALSPATPAIDAEQKAALDAKPDAAAGKIAYEACEGCHRKDGSGRANGTYPRLAGQHARVVIKQLVDIRSGRRHNPEMAPLVTGPVLSLQAMADIAVHVQGLPVSANNGKGPGTALSAAQQLYERDCVACHGARGEGAAANFVPMVAAQHYRYLLRELLNIRDGTRRNSNAEMVKVVAPYSPAELDMLADYLSRLPPGR